jgi:hypothetical protein
MAGEQRLAFQEGHRRSDCFYLGAESTRDPVRKTETSTRCDQKQMRMSKYLIFILKMAHARKGQKPRGLLFSVKKLQWTTGSDYLFRRKSRSNYLKYPYPIRSELWRKWHFCRRGRQGCKKSTGKILGRECVQGRENVIKPAKFVKTNC